MQAKRLGWLRWVIGLPLLLMLGAAGAGYVFLRASLPQLDGERVAKGLHAVVTVDRDAFGVPLVTGKDRVDVAYATGFLHAQDRFFQMDLLRRTAAGELAGLVGPAALPLDRRHRLFRFRARAEAALLSLTPADRAVLDRYVAGVNDGLRALQARSFEYALLNQYPTPWHREDSLLVIWAMYFDLQGDVGRKATRGWIAEHTTPAQRDFLFPQSSPWDAPLDATSVDAAAPPVPATAPDWLGVGAGTNDGLTASADMSTSNVGSNNWAVSGTRSEHGSGILANDMHLGLRLPHIWYRMALQYSDAAGKPRRLVGVTLPGVPALVAGSNGHVAWGFTNSYGDYMDLVALQRDPKNAARYQTANGWDTIQRFSERIDVKGAPPETLAVEETPLGPIRQFGDKTYAIHWIASENGAVNTDLLGLEAANDLVSLQAAANRAGIPAQNIVAADNAGHIGWTIAGPLPERRWQYQASFPYAATDAALGWAALRAPGGYPRVIDPPGGQLWTANSRQLAGPDYALLGDGGADLGARATQVRDDVRALGRTDEKALFQVGLDDRALFMSHWRDRALKALDDKAVAGHAQRAEFRRLLRDSWDDRASIGSVGYRLAHAYLNALYREMFGRLDDKLARELGAPLTFRWSNSRWEYVLGRLDDVQPAAWVPSGMKDWHAVELAAIDDVIAVLTEKGQPLSAATWGQRNTAEIGHPFGHLLPVLSRWLSAPADELPGDDNMPRVAAPGFGQSERMVVAPGHEEMGLFDMPGGESGHPLSPYFLAGHAAWVHGEALPLLPGPAQHTLKLRPAG